VTNRALEGVRVLDLSRILAAPLAGQMMGDLGADVIEVERSREGDDSRQYGPPFLEVDWDGGLSAFYLSCNRNKRSVTLDLATPRGRELLLGLVSRSDVLLENFRPGVLATYGLDHESLRERFPRLVYCSVTGFGQDGPSQDRPGYDGIFQALSGMMSDVLTGLYTGTAVLAALRERERSGVGQHLDVSLLDCGPAAMSHYAENYLVSGEVPERRGNGGFGGIPSQAFTAADGRLFFIVATTDPQFGRACRAIGHPHLIQDPRFGSIAARIEHRLELLAELEEIFRNREAAHWIDVLTAADIPVAPVNDLRSALDDPQVRSRGMRIEMEHPAAGTVPGPRYPIRMSGSPVDAYTAPPALGEHTAEVLTGVLGVAPAEPARLAVDGVV
jgi:crotonobetainyl-CoA:carnitine CoA-transferase CaiB-like acyl-CoA transferase